MDESTDIRRQSTVITVSLYPEQLTVLSQVSRDTGLENISATIRMIVNDYAKRIVPQNADSGASTSGRS